MKNQPEYLEALYGIWYAGLVAVPVLVGSLGRIIVGGLTDRFGGRLMFPIVSGVTIVPEAVGAQVGLARLAVSSRTPTVSSMAPGWMPFFDNLRLYLTHFPGQEATRLEATAGVWTPCSGGRSRTCRMSA